jgi:hypothetical protein
MAQSRFVSSLPINVQADAPGQGDKRLRGP